MAETPPRDRLLSVRDLRVDYFPEGGDPRQAILQGVDLDLGLGEAVALVGPSGCGKSVTAHALLGLLSPGFRWRGDVRWRGQALRDPAGPRWQQVRGRGLGLIRQEPLTSLNPVLTAGDQIAESLRLQRGLSATAARQEALALLEETRVPDPERCADSYAHQLSGGMRQRVLLAATLACDPELLIADEPTTALDVSVQKDILVLIDRIRRERGMALLFITHDLNLAPLLVDRVAVMAEGRISHLVAAGNLPLMERPSVEVVAPRAGPPVLTARGLVVRFAGTSKPAVAGVDLELLPGQVTGLLGESGCGKTSLARALACHLDPQAGEMSLSGARYPAPNEREMRAQRRRVQMLFQEPGGSLDPRQTVGRALREAGDGGAADPASLLAEVGLAASLAERYPHQLSGGQRQRVALARCLAASPAVLIADEPCSALDAAARDQVLQLLVRIVKTRGLALLIISHDLEVLAGACAQIQVMVAGVVVEVIPGGPNFEPRHPYSQELAALVPRALRGHPALWARTRQIPADNLVGTTGGCPRYGLCPLQKPICGKELPPLKMVAASHLLRCPPAEAGGPSHFIDTL